MRVSTGPEQRFAELFRQHHDAVFSYALRRGDRHVAADVASEVFLIAWRRLDDVPKDALPWLLASARRVLANQRRAGQRAVSLGLRLERERPRLDPEVEDEVSTRLSWARAVSGLSDGDQEALTLIAWDGLTAREAAASLECSVPAFLMRLHRARSRLAERLRETPPHDDPAPEPANPAERQAK